MSTATKKNIKTQFAKNIKSLLANNNIASSGSGNPFWTVNISELTEFECTLALSAKENVYLIPNMEGVNDENGKELPPFHINLGTHFDAIQTYEEQIGETIKINVAVRKPNSSITQEDLDRVTAQYGTQAIASYTRAEASGEQTIVLMNYVLEE